jgi:hypothetical protein
VKEFAKLKCVPLKKFKNQSGMPSLINIIVVDSLSRLSWRTARRWLRATVLQKVVDTT